MAEKRLYVGNLPADTTEHDLRKFFKKFGLSSVELKHKSGSPRTATFAYINISADQVDDCVEKCRSKKLKDSQIKIEVAKESFLEKLQKERDKRNDINSSSKNFSNCSFFNDCTVAKNKKIVFSDDENDSATTGFGENSCNSVICLPTSSKSEKKKLRANSSKSHSDSDDSDDDISRKRNLPRFRGTASLHVSDQEQPRSHFSMKRFEEFSEVWRDSSPEEDVNKCKKLKWKRSNPVADFKQDQSQSPVETVKFKQNAKNAADCKRVNALQEKWNVLKEKKNAIRKALKNLETNKTKIQYSEPEKTVSRGIEDVGKKLVLFENDVSDDDFQVNFDGKKQLDGKNGLKLLKLKSKLANDERFKLDDRFYEDDVTQTDGNCRLNSSNRLSSESEDRKKELWEARPMVRYDPAREDHKLLEKQPPNKTVEKKKKVKKKRDKNKSIEGKSEITTTSKPEVSKEKHYSVSDSLKTAFKKPDENTSFSLSALFDEQIQKNRSTVEDEPAEAVPLKKFKPIENHFENASESDEDDEVPADEEPLDISLNAVPNVKIPGKCGVWGDKFFFQPDDPRFKEGMKFFTEPSKPSYENFDECRRRLKKIFRKKLQNCRRDHRLFKQKVGGRLNRSKFQKRLRDARV